MSKEAKHGLVGTFINALNFIIIALFCVGLVYFVYFYIYSSTVESDDNYGAVGSALSNVTGAYVVVERENSSGHRVIDRSRLPILYMYEYNTDNDITYINVSLIGKRENSKTLNVMHKQILNYFNKNKYHINVNYKFLREDSDSNSYYEYEVDVKKVF